jgi:hypothetical protein
MVMFYPAARFVTHSMQQTNRLPPPPPVTKKKKKKRKKEVEEYLYSLATVLHENRIYEICVFDLFNHARIMLIVLD